MRRRALKSTHFWNSPKELNPAHADYRPASSDLPLQPGEWIYKKSAYDNDILLMTMSEKNLSKLSEDLNPKQRI